MSILNYKVVSYVASNGSQPYCHGFYDTLESAERVRDDYNAMWASHKVLVAKVEKAR